MEVEGVCCEGEEVVWGWGSIVWRLEIRCMFTVEVLNRSVLSLV
jgi:hypothetical protein